MLAEVTSGSGGFLALMAFHTCSPSLLTPLIEHSVQLDPGVSMLCQFLVVSTLEQGPLGRRFCLLVLIPVLMSRWVVLLFQIKSLVV